MARMGEVRQREPRIEVPTLLKTADGAPCFFRIPGICNGRTDTSVWCHSNEARHGKAVGRKSDDPFGAIGCRACHDWYDIESRKDASPVQDFYLAAIERAERMEARRALFQDAFDRTLRWLWETGRLRVNTKIR